MGTEIERGSVNAQPGREHPEGEQLYRLLSDARAHTFRVKDNGSGIPAYILDSVFLPFSKGETGQTGIGLAIVEKIVKAYNGEAKACNDDGAVFEVTFRGVGVPGEDEGINEE